MRDRVVVLAHQADVAATAVAGELERRLGPRVVEVVRPEVLGLCRWRLEIGSDGRTEGGLQLPSGRTVHSGQVACLFNRLMYLPNPRFVRASPKDRDYAGAELQAVLAAWLFSLGTRVVNPSGPRGMARGPATQRGWLALSASNGLPVVRNAASTSGRLLNPGAPPQTLRPRYDWPGDGRGPMPVDLEVAAEPAGDLLVIGSQASGGLSTRFGEKCCSIAKDAGCSLLEFRFGRVGDEDVLVSVETLPQLLQACAVAAVCDYICSVAEHPVRTGLLNGDNNDSLLRT